MAERQPIVTIDGPSGSGKSTISRMLARQLGFTYLDTGAMYRAVALKLHRLGVGLDDQAALKELLETTEITLIPNGDDDVRVLLDGEDVSTAIRTPEMALAASRVSAHPMVRRRLTELQRTMGAHGGIVAEGRDMGTVVFPDAEFKFYLTAAPEERARRRASQLAQKGMAVDEEEILDQIRKRDYDDARREHAPLKPAEDAVVVDCSTLGPDEVVDKMLEVISRRQGG